MKRIFAALLGIVIVFSFIPVCFADVDLSGMSFEELVALKDQINLAIWNSDEWQEVEVPQGVWKVGEDIPAGHWTILALPGKLTRIYVGPKTKNCGTDVDWKTFAYVIGEGYPDPSDGMLPEWSIELSDGDFVKIEKSSAVFTPYAGKPDLGFKK